MPFHHSTWRRLHILALQVQHPRRQVCDLLVELLVFLPQCVDYVIQYQAVVAAPGMCASACEFLSRPVRFRLVKPDVCTLPASWADMQSRCAAQAINAGAR